MSFRRRSEVRIIVEGGGKDGPFRERFKTFFSKFVPSEVDGSIADVAIVRGQNGEEVGKKFAQQRKLDPNALLIRFVDSEFPVPFDSGIRAFLIERGGFLKPHWAEESNVYLMVQCVETWIAADVDALKPRFKDKHREKRLPMRSNLEEEPKSELQLKLKTATSELHEHPRSADLMGLVRPASLEKLSHGNRLINELIFVIERFASGAS